VPVIFGLSAAPTSMNMLELIDETVAGGGQMYGLINCRGASSIYSFQTRLPFDALPGWNTLRSEPLERQRRLLQDPDVRASLIRQAHESVDRSGPGSFRADFDAIEVMTSAYKPNPTVAQMARERRIDPVDLMIDLALDHDFDLFFVQRFAEFEEPDEKKFVATLQNRNTAMTFSDSGAHVGQLVDASIQTHLLAYWVREREALTLEEAIQMITRRPADIWRLHDRGLLREGLAADITIFDPEKVAPDLPQVVTDLPGGARRLIQTAKGYKATIVNGQVLLRDGRPTEARAGQLLRHGR
jgi:N-acyl-D-amino-acid deacylase